MFLQVVQLYFDACNITGCSVLQKVLEDLFTVEVRGGAHIDLAVGVSYTMITVRGNVKW